MSFIFATLTAAVGIGASVFYYVTKNSDVMPWASPVDGPVSNISIIFAPAQWGGHYLEQWKCNSPGYAPTTVGKLKLLSWLHECSTLGMLRGFELSPTKIVRAIKCVGQLSEKEVDALNKILSLLATKNSMLFNKQVLWFPQSLISTQNITDLFGLVEIGSSWNLSCSFYSRETAGSFHLVYSVLAMLVSKMSTFSELQQKLQTALDDFSDMRKEIQTMTITGSNNFSINEETRRLLVEQISRLDEMSAKIEENTQRIESNTVQINNVGNKCDLNSQKIESMDARIEELLSMMLSQKESMHAVEIGCMNAEKNLMSQISSLNEKFIKAKKELTRAMETKTDFADFMDLVQSIATMEEMYNNCFDKMHEKAQTLKLDIMHLKQTAKKPVHK